MKRKVALCAAMYKGIEPEVANGLLSMAFTLGRHTKDVIKPFIAVRKRAELAANWALGQMEKDERINGHRFTHVIWMDDDIVVEGKSILKLLDSIDDEHPVVFALAFERDGLHKPGIWRSKTFGGRHVNVEQIFDYPPNELMPIHAAGLCCAAWDREVLTAIKKPYFDWQQAGYGRSSHTPDGYFCNKLRDKDIPIFCHTGVKVGHMSYPVEITETVALRFKPGWRHSEHDTK